MPTDPEVLSALAAAVHAQPGAVKLRLHLASLLLESGAEGAALEHYTTALAQEPDNQEALEGAARACDRLGFEERAAGYQAVLAGLRPRPAGAGRSEHPDLRREAPVAFPEPPEGDAGPAGARRVESQTPWWEVQTSQVRWQDVGGMEEAKRQLHLALLAPIRNPELARAYGKVIRGGLLMYGPPGCGKTFLARATAGELNAGFLSVGLPDILDMWIGESEKHLHEMFETARRNRPCAVFLDELDALGQRRTQLRLHAAQRGVVNQLLAEMDGMGTANEGVYVIGATNHPWDVDPALLRPGRFDDLVLVLPPDVEARAQILRGQLRGRPVDVDVDWLAQATEDFSGADLAHLCNTAVEGAMEESLLSGLVRTIRKPDFQQALRRVKPSTRPWFETARNFVLFANDGGLYDPLQAYMRRRGLL